MAKFIQFIALLLLVSPLCFGQEKDDDESATPEKSESDQLAELVKLLQPNAQQPPQQQPQQQPGKEQKPIEKQPPQTFPQQPQQPQQRPQQPQQEQAWLSKRAQKREQWQQFFKQWLRALAQYNLLQQLWQPQKGAQQAPNNLATGQQKASSSQDLLRSLVLPKNA